MFRRGAVPTVGYRNKTKLDIALEGPGIGCVTTDKLGG